MVVIILISTNLSEKYGKKGVLLAVSGIISIIGFVVTYIVPINEGNKIYLAIIPVVCVGTFAALYEGSYWPAISIICNQRNIAKEVEKGEDDKRIINLSGIAFGIAIAVNNIGLASFPILFGWINSPPSKETYNQSLIV